MTERTDSERLDQLEEMLRKRLSRRWRPAMTRAKPTPPWAGEVKRWRDG